MIYCVEDDASIRDIEVYALLAMGFQAKGFADAAAFRQGLAQERPELVILDIMLPGEDGISLLKELKARPATASIPVIMATAKGTEYDKVKGLDLGADDYLVKPFGMMEMTSRVKAVLRRTQGEPSGILRLGNLELNDREHVVTASGRTVELTLKEYELLKLLLSTPGVVYTREQLLSQVWGISHAETRTVDAHVKTLRQKLGAFGNLIETVRGVGYRIAKDAHA